MASAASASPSRRRVAGPRPSRHAPLDLVALTRPLPAPPPVVDPPAPKPFILPKPTKPTTRQHPLTRPPTRHATQQLPVTAVLARPADQICDKCGALVTSTELWLRYPMHGRDVPPIVCHRACEEEEERSILAFERRVAAVGWSFYRH